MPLPGRQHQGFAATVTTIVTSALLTVLLSSLMAAPAQAGLTGHVRLPAAARSVQVCSTAKVTQFRCFAEQRTDTTVLPRGTTSSPAFRAARVAAGLSALAAPPGLHPADLTAAYGLPSATRGYGQTVYIVDAYDYPNAEADLAVYRAQYALPPCTTANGCFRKVNQNGLSTPLPTPDNGWSAEMALDLDMVSAVCPNCHITLVEANDAGYSMFTAVDRANALGAKFVSMSWGGMESKNAAALDAAHFALSGVVYAAASGDSGYVAPFYPASSNRVVAVGGTSLVRSSSVRGWSESAWAGAGSGCSGVEGRPAWQAGTTACATRGIADISAVADPSTGVSVYLTSGGNGWSIYGGTSASAPIVAAAFALAGAQPAGAKPAQALYAHPSRLNDVTTGSNGSCSPGVLCHAGPGWDGPTGLGTPHGISAFVTTRGTAPTAVMGRYFRSRPAATGGNSVLPPHG